MMMIETGEFQYKMRTVNFRLELQERMRELRIDSVSISVESQRLLAHLMPMECPSDAALMNSRVFDGEVSFPFEF